MPQGIMSCTFPKQRERRMWNKPGDLLEGNKEGKAREEKKKGREWVFPQLEGLL